MGTGAGALADGCGVTTFGAWAGGAAGAIDFGNSVLGASIFGAEAAGA